MSSQPLTPTDREALRKSRLFRGADIELVDHLLQDCTVRGLRPGEILLARGEAPSEDVFVVMCGRVSVHLAGAESPSHTVIDAGECVGEMSAIDGEPISATVTALEAARLATTLDFLLLAIRVAAKQYLKRGDDLLRLIERTGAIVDAARGARGDGGKTDAGLHLLRGIAMAELLHAESVGRFARHAGLRARADAAMASLVDGFLARFGGELPTEVRKAFPGFAAALRHAWRPIKERRGLLLWLTQRG